MASRIFQAFEAEDLVSEVKKTDEFDEMVFFSFERTRSLNYAKLFTRYGSLHYTSLQ